MRGFCFTELWHVDILSFRKRIFIEALDARIQFALRQFLFIPLALHRRRICVIFYTIVIISTSSLRSVSIAFLLALFLSLFLSRRLFHARFFLHVSRLVLSSVVSDAARVAQRLWSVWTVTPQRRRVRVAVRASLPWNTTRRLSIRHPFFCSVLSFSLSPRSQPPRIEGH